LLSTLEKLLEAVVAENNIICGGDLRTSAHQPLRRMETEVAEQALLLLQERIYTAWRGKKVVILVSFDVKGA